MYELIRAKGNSRYTESPAKIGLVMNFQRHTLVSSTVRSYLTWMKETGRMETVIESNRLLWRAHT